MKTYKVLITLTFALFIIAACQKAPLDEPLTAIDLKVENQGNDKLTGFDEWGINWGAHQFHGYTLNMLLGDYYFYGWPHYKKHVYGGDDIEFWYMLVDNYPYFPYLIPGELYNSKLVCNWNDALISKDGVYPPTWLDTDAWITFNYSGEIDNKKWSSKRKLVAAKSTDVFVKEDTNGDGNVDMMDLPGVWYNADGDEIGLDSLFWPDLVVIQVVNHGDVPAYPFFYQDYNSPNGSGLGK